MSFLLGILLKSGKHTEGWSFFFFGLASSENFKKKHPPGGVSRGNPVRYEHKVVIKNHYFAIFINIGLNYVILDNMGQSELISKCSEQNLKRFYNSKAS